MPSLYDINWVEYILVAGIPRRQNNEARRVLIPAKSKSSFFSSPLHLSSALLRNSVHEDVELQANTLAALLRSRESRYLPLVMGAPCCRPAGHAPNRCEALAVSGWGDLNLSATQ